MKVNLKALIRCVSWKSRAKPILKKSPQHKVKRSGSRRSKNQYRPGFVYVFQDPETQDTQNKTLCKIGLSGTPRSRCYYLSQEYGSDLVIRAIAFTLNMRLTEIWMHQIFKADSELRTPGLDGFTEWFRVNYLRMKWMQIMLLAVASFVTLTHAIIILIILSVCITLLWFLLF